MRLGFDLSLEQAQKLIMTPELRQAIQLLQFTSLELREYIDQQMESNPLLEIDSKSQHEDIEDPTKEMDQEDWKEYLGQYDDISYKSNRKSEQKDYSFENFVSEEKTLKDHLLLQMDLTIFDEINKQIAELIIESIDKNGYLSNPIKDIAKQLNVNIKEVEKVLKVVQTFDPVGVAARDLGECLINQLKIKGIKDDIAFEIVDKYLEDIAMNKLSKIGKKLNTDIEHVQKVCDLIKSLEPKPGRGFYHEGDDVKFVTPDVVVEKVDGEFVIIVKDSTAPKLSVNSFYKQMINNEDNDTSKFITQKLNSAMWLIKSIEQRRMTIYNVVKSLLKFQKDFFEKGKMSLKPLTLKEVAEDIDVHESTVSRATNGKYVQTPRGIFELRYFFSSGVKGKSGEVASTSVKTMISEMIESENPKKPLSDQKIADNLKEKNIKISRRTVAKYRDELNIPSSTRRKRYS
ncbi:MAG: RNA polymerase factor sigma-54 [Firmicutes bacterium]|nr:RNA polymerase factor sigma-54 [Bacillota bacterium]